MESTVGFQTSGGQSPDSAGEDGPVPFGEPVVRFDAVGMRYGQAPEVFSNLTFQLPVGSFHFLTGASGAGKTTLLDVLEQQLDPTYVSFNRFDSIGIPSEEDMIKSYGSGKKWQEIKTYEWVERLVNLPDKKLIFLEGQSEPRFFIDPLKKLNIENYIMICLHVHKDLREYRVINLRKQPELANPDMDNWAELLKKQTIDVDGVVIESEDTEMRTNIHKIAEIIINKIKG